MTRVLPSPAFRERAPLAWSYHRATCRWAYNAAHEADDRPEPPEEHLGADFLPLPPPAEPRASLEGLLSDRFSCRAFDDVPLDEKDIATLAALAYGTFGHTSVGAVGLPTRPVPSAGGMYPLELYFLIRASSGLPPGVHHYHPYAHGLEHLRDVLLPSRYISYLFMNQYWFAQAAAIAVITAVPRRCARKYGDRAYRYLLLEAGHVAQNFALAAAALGLGSCCGGGFFDDELAGLILADIEEEVPLYAVALGRPAPVDRAALRIGDTTWRHATIDLPDC